MRLSSASFLASVSLLIISTKLVLPEVTAEDTSPIKDLSLSSASALAVFSASIKPFNLESSSSLFVASFSIIPITVVAPLVTDDETSPMASQIFLSFSSLAPFSLSIFSERAVSLLSLSEISLFIDASRVVIFSFIPLTFTPFSERVRYSSLLGSILTFTVSSVFSSPSLKAVNGTIPSVEMLTTSPFSKMMSIFLVLGLYLALSISFENFTSFMSAVAIGVPPEFKKTKASKSSLYSTPKNTFAAKSPMSPLPRLVIALQSMLASLEYSPLSLYP